MGDVRETERLTVERERAGGIATGLDELSDADLVEAIRFGIRGCALDLDHPRVVRLMEESLRRWETAEIVKEPSDLDTLKEMFDQCGTRYDVSTRPGRTTLIVTDAGGWFVFDGRGKLIENL